MSRDAEEFLGALEGLRVWRRFGTTAPHKPLLLLLTLARVRSGLPRLMAFAEVEAPLRHLIELVEPGRRGQPQYPFWRLQSDGIWEVVGAERLQRRAGSTDVPATVLRSAQAHAGLLPRFDAVLRSNPLLVEEAVGLLVRRLPASHRHDVLTDLGRLGGSIGTPVAMVDRPYVAVDHLGLPAAARSSAPDPDLYGRGLQAHRHTQTCLASFLKANGIEPRAPLGSAVPFDLLWRRDGVAFVAEVKSLTDSNEEHQLRLGMGQVLRYHQAVTRTGQAAVAVLAVERAPTDRSWTDLCAHGIVLTWPTAFDNLLCARPTGFEPVTTGV